MKKEQKEIFLEKIQKKLDSKFCWFVTYWSQPLNGSTTQKFEKWDTDNDINNLTTIREIDASSLPSGGLRSTNKAKGLLYPDFTSNIYYYRNSLYIPSFIKTIDGKSIDYKTPLLKSIERLSNITLKIFQTISRSFELNNNYESVNHIYPTLGIEQEFFLIDKKHFDKRYDLSYTGRTLFGNLPPKHQQMEDQYFGDIPENIDNFFHTLFEKCDETELDWITKHLEVALKQYETALNFTDANTAVDNNLFLMKLIKDSALEHNLVSLFHEKPFEGINGSGKHCNWSLMTDQKNNLLDWKKTPKILFITFFINIIKAVSDYEELLRASVASYSNDMRLGGNEAPPSIISVFTGEQLSDENYLFDLDNNNLLDIDRNRTSPFPFTDNRFEFRAVGSSQNPSFAITCLNSIVAKTLEDFYNSLNNDFSTDNILNNLKEIFNDSKNIIYNDDCYSDEWVNEAYKRGISNNKTTTEAIECLTHTNIKELFNGILTRDELHAIYEVKIDEYIKSIQIEINTMNNIIINQTNNKKLMKNRVKFEFDSDDIYNIDNMLGYLNEYRNKLNNLEWKTKDIDWHIPRLIDILK